MLLGSSSETLRHALLKISHSCAALSEGPLGTIEQRPLYWGGLAQDARLLTAGCELQSRMTGVARQAAKASPQQWISLMPQRLRSSLARLQVCLHSSPSVLPSVVLPFSDRIH